MQIDDIDSRIIDLLTKDSRVSLRKIAKEIGLTVDTVSRRFRKLEKEKVIQPTITIDLVKLGYDAFVFFGIMVTSQNARRKITEKVAEIPDVVAVMETAGVYDLTVIAAVRNVTHTYDVGESISKVDGVRKVSIGNFQLFSKDYGRVYPPLIWNNLDL